MWRLFFVALNKNLPAHTGSLDTAANILLHYSFLATAIVSFFRLEQIKKHTVPTRLITHGLLDAGPVCGVQITVIYVPTRLCFFFTFGRSNDGCARVRRYLFVSDATAASPAHRGA